MKYLIFLLLLFLFPFQPHQFSIAEEKVCYYAKITSSNTYFYNSCNDKDKLFKIPQSYFVLLTETADDNFYCAKYGDCVGFVKKKEVTPMNGTPSKPYATNYNFRITSLSGLPIFLKPTFESEQITSIEFLEDKLYYYGNLQGQEYFPNSTDIWYYCSYTKDNETFYGYVFSYYCDFINEVKNNREYFEEITGTLTFKPNYSPSNSLSNTIKAIIILAVIIPILIGIYIFTSPKKTKGQKKIIKRHKDYYELNESDLN